MFDPRLARTLLALCVASAPLAVEAGPVTPPTPPACAADGHCAPDRDVWGYTRQKWRRWPGSADADKRPGEAGGVPTLPPTSPPAKELEDQTAPPPVEAIEPRPREEVPLDEELGRDDFGPRRPAENGALDRRFPGDAEQPRGGFPPPGQPDDTPDFLRNRPNQGLPGINAPLTPPGGTPPVFEPGLTPPPPGQPPSGPTEPGLRDPDLPPAGGETPDDDFFPNFNTSSRQGSDDAPPALPFGVTRQAPRSDNAATGVAPTATVRTASTLPRPVAPSIANTTRTGPATVRSERKVDHGVRPASFEQDAPPSLPVFLQ